MRKRIILVFLATLSFLYAQEYRFSTDIRINKVLKANVNQMNFIYIYEENSDFKIIIGEDDGYDYLFCDKESFNSLKAFVKEINNMADKSKAVNEIHVFNNGWSFIYDDCDLTLVRRKHFVFEKDNKK